MIRLRGLTLSRGGRELLRDADASLGQGERVALIGANGSGKTSLLSALAGDGLIDAGDIDQPYRRVTRLEQSVPTSDRPAWEFLIEGDNELIAAQRALDEAQSRSALGQMATTQTVSDEAGLQWARAHAAWLEAGGADAAARAHALLAGLGFSEQDALSPVSHLSGGWRMRLNLARALFAPGDLLLLDEPTNHLDLDAVLWLERWLTRCDSTMLIVSHDRDFLDKVVRACLQIEDGKLHRYSGGYSDFEQARALRAQQAARAQHSLAAQRAHLESFINRFRAQANRARQVQSRLKTLERMASIAPIRSLRGIDIELPPVGESPEILLRAESLAAGYGDTVVVRSERLQILRGARIGILGRNGAGKSTLIKTLVGDVAALGGELALARGLRVGYFAQQAVESLREEESALRHLQRAAPDEREQVLRDFLGRFGFRGEDATRPTGPMSGGEKSRLVLALVVWSKPQLLVLDEPTNHLDAHTRDALADALASYEGALLLVSHDRYLLRASVDRLLIVDGGALLEYDGDLDDYNEWIATRVPRRPNERPVDLPGNHAHGIGVGPTDRREARRLAAERRATIAAHTRAMDAEIRALEEKMKSMTAELAALEAQLQDPRLYEPGSDPKAAAELNRRRAELSRENDACETRWLELQEAREAAIAAIDRA